MQRQTIGDGAHGMLSDTELKIMAGAVFGREKALSFNKCSGGRRQIR